MSCIVLLQIICGARFGLAALAKKIGGEEKIFKFMSCNRRLAEPRDENFYAIFYGGKKKHDRVIKLS